MNTDLKQIIEVIEDHIGRVIDHGQNESTLGQTHYFRIHLNDFYHNCLDNGLDKLLSEITRKIPNCLSVELAEDERVSNKIIVVIGKPISITNVFNQTKYEELSKRIASTAQSILTDIQTKVGNLLSDIEISLDYDDDCCDVYEYDSEDDERIPEGLALYPGKFVEINSIIVPTEYDKEQLLLAFKYIHGLKCIDTDYIAVNSLAHLYQQPEIIKVSKNDTNSIS